MPHRLLGIKIEIHDCQCKERKKSVTEIKRFSSSDRNYGIFIQRADSKKSKGNKHAAVGFVGQEKQRTQYVEGNSQT